MCYYIMCPKLNIYIYPYIKSVFHFVSHVLWFSGSTPGQDQFRCFPFHLNLSCFQLRIWSGVILLVLAPHLGSQGQVLLLLAMVLKSLSSYSCRPNKVLLRTWVFLHLQWVFSISYTVMGATYAPSYHLCSSSSSVNRRDAYLQRWCLTAVFKLLHLGVEKSVHIRTIKCSFKQPF